MTLPLAGALAVVVVTSTLMILRPGRIHESVWTCCGAAVMMLMGLASVQTITSVLVAMRPPLLFLGALMLLSAFAAESGFFAWAAETAARAAGGDSRRLFRNIFLLGTAITVTLSLDTTALLLSPLVLTLAKRKGVSARPYVFACIATANVGSLLLPVSNLTNLIYADAFQISATSFLSRFAAPQAAALAVAYWFLLRRLRAYLTNVLPNTGAGPDPSLVPHAGYFRATCIVLAAVVLGYFVGPLFGVEPATVAGVGAVGLGAYGIAVGRVRRATFSRVPWKVFPFVLGAFILVAGVSRAGAAAPVARLLQTTSESMATRAGLSVALATFFSNLVNNLPAALFCKFSLVGAHAEDPAVFATLIGANAGSMIFPTGSLATMLVLDVAKSHGEVIERRDVVTLCALVACGSVLAAYVALVTSFAIAP